MYWNTEVTPEETEEILQKIAKRIHDYQMETIAILTLESMKPLAFVGSNLGRAVLSPFLPALGENLGVMGDKYLFVFEERANVERLVTILEEQVKADEAEKKRRKAEKKAQQEEEKKRQESVKEALEKAKASDQQ